MLDLVVGRGTTANTIFDLKSTGAFKGAKRKLKFPREEYYKPVSKCQKINLVEHMFRDLKFENNSTPEKIFKRADVVVKISDSKGGWCGNKKSPRKLGENILNTPTGRRRSIKDSENRSDQPRTPSSSNKRKKLRKTCSRTPSRGQGTILEFLSSRKDMATGAREKREELDLVSTENDV